MARKLMSMVLVAVALVVAGVLIVPGVVSAGPVADGENGSFCSRHGHCVSGYCADGQKCDAQSL